MLNCTRFLQLVLENNREKAQIPFGMNVPTAFLAQLFFRAMAFLSEKVRRKTLNIFRNKVKITLAGMAFQLV